MLMAIPAFKMKNKNYAIIVERWLLGPYEIKLVKSNTFNVTSTLTTRSIPTMFNACFKLIESDEPEVLCKNLERPWNLSKKNKIRLDVTK